MLIYVDSSPFLVVISETGEHLTSNDPTYHHVHGSLGLHRAEAGDSADPLVEVLGILLYIVQCFLKEVLWGAR